MSSTRTIDVTILNGAKHMRNSSSRRPRGNPDFARSGKAVALGLAGGAAVYLAVKGLSSLKKGGTGANKDQPMLDGYKGAAAVAVVGVVTGGLAAGAENPMLQTGGAAVLGATALAAGAQAWMQYQANKAREALVTANANVAIGQQLRNADGTPRVDANGAPVLRTAGVYGLNGGRSPYQTNAAQARAMAGAF